jgi:ferredoxin
VRIVLDSERCTGHGRCYSLSPELFDSDERGHCVVLHAVVPEGEETKARTAVDNCPENALSLED